MGEFVASIQERIRDEEAALRRATEGGDDYLVEVHTGELEDLRRLASEHGIASAAEPAAAEGVELA
jgi:hypothetical protein